ALRSERFAACARREFAIKSPPRKIELLALPPKTPRARTGRKGQEPKQYVFSKLVYALPSRRRAQVSNGLKTVPLGNTVEYFDVDVSANDVDVREIGVVVEKLS